jgi:hypothetical protein
VRRPETRAPDLSGDAVDPGSAQEAALSHSGSGRSNVRRAADARDCGGPELPGVLDADIRRLPPIEREFLLLIFGGCKCSRRYEEIWSSNCRSQGRAKRAAQRSSTLDTGNSKNIRSKILCLLIDY